jgi:hypothetical protein
MNATSKERVHLGVIGLINTKLIGPKMMKAKTHSIGLKTMGA